MNTFYSNATVMWTEREIMERIALIQQCYQTIKDAWVNLNQAVHFERVETPILTPKEYLSGHIKAGFPMLSCDRGILRPETTAGCIMAFHTLYPTAPQRKKRMPFCVWQVGKSFREEKNPETMRASKLRLVEFYQMEFQLFTSANTGANYLEAALDGLTKRFGGKSVLATEGLPHYSIKTIDWEIDGLELAGCSVRKDWPEGLLFEVSIGLDRLLATILNRENK